MTIAQSETTKTDSSKDSGFYSGITIEGFRQFKKLELTNLGKLNLVSDKKHGWGQFYP